MFCIIISKKNKHQETISRIIIIECLKKKVKKKKHLDRNSNNFIKKLKNKHLDPTWCRGESVLLVHWVMVAAHLMDRYIRSAHLWPLMYALIDQHFILIRERERWRERHTNRERGGRETERQTDRVLICWQLSLLVCFFLHLHFT